MKKKYFKIVKKRFFFFIMFFFSLGFFFHFFQIIPTSKIRNYYETLQAKYPQTFGIKLYRQKEILKNPDYANFTTRSRFVKNYEYTNGDNIWSDRLYFNNSDFETMNNSILILIPRHYKKLISIKFDTKINFRVMRVLCSNNDNNSYLHWNKLEENMRIIGKSCVHSKIVFKDFYLDEINLPPGGPFSSDPIFLKLLKNGSSLKISVN